MARYSFLIVILMTIGQGLTAQVRPDHFVEETSPNNSNFETYSQKGGVNRRASMANLRKYFGAEIVNGSTPALSGNGESLRNKVILVLPDSVTYFVDYLGDAVKLGSGNAGGSVYEIDAVADTTTVSDPREGDLAFAPDTLLVYGSSWLVFSGGDNWGVQSVAKDSTLRGNGTSGDPLRVNRDSFPTSAEVDALIDVVGDTLTDLRSAITALQAQTAAVLDSLNNIPDGSGTTGQFGRWLDGNTLTGSDASQTADGVVIAANKAFRQIGGITVSRPSGTAGQYWYNTSTIRPQVFTSAWRDIVTTNAAVVTNQVTYGGSGGDLTSSSNLTFNGSLLNISGALTTSGNITVTGGRLIVNRVSDIYFDLGNTGSVFRFTQPSPVGGGPTYVDGNKLFVTNLSYNSNKLSGHAVMHGVPLGFYTAKSSDERESFAFMAYRNSSSSQDYYLSLYSYGNDIVGSKSIYKDSILHILPNGFVGFGVVPTRQIDLSGNIRIRGTGGIYDYNNSAGSVGQHLQKAGNGIQWTYGSYASNFGSTDTLVLTGSSTYKTIKTWNTSDFASSDWAKTDSSLIYNGGVTNVPYEISFCVSFRAWTGSILELNLVSSDGSTNSIFSASRMYKKIVAGAEDCVCGTARWQSSTTFNRIKLRAGGTFSGQIKLVGGFLGVKQL